MSDFIRVGGIQKLQDGEFIVQVCIALLPFLYFPESYRRIPCIG